MRFVLIFRQNVTRKICKRIVVCCICGAMTARLTPRQKMRVRSMPGSLICDAMVDNVCQFPPYFGDNLNELPLDLEQLGLVGFIFIYFFGNLFIYIFCYRQLELVASTFRDNLSQLLQFWRQLELVGSTCIRYLFLYTVCCSYVLLLETRYASCLQIWKQT